MDSPWIELKAMIERDASSDERVVLDAWIETTERYDMTELVAVSTLSNISHGMCLVSAMADAMDEHGI